MEFFSILFSEEDTYFSPFASSLAENPVPERAASVLTFCAPCDAADDLFKERIKNAPEDAHSIYLAARYSNPDKVGGAREEADCPSR